MELEALESPVALEAWVALAVLESLAASAVLAGRATDGSIIPPTVAGPRMVTGKQHPSLEVRRGPVAWAIGEERPSVTLGGLMAILEV